MRPMSSGDLRPWSWDPTLNRKGLKLHVPAFLSHEHYFFVWSLQRRVPVWEMVAFLAQTLLFHLVKMLTYFRWRRYWCSLCRL